MAWDFSTDPEVQAKLDWADRFVAEEIEPVESLLYDVVDVGRPEGAMASLFEQWRQEVKDQGLYAAHLPQDRGGAGFGEVNLALLNEVIGRSYWAPYIFATGPGTPGSGQSDVLAVFGTEEQKQRWLYPLLEGKITMIYSMTEPHGGADPTGFRCQAVRDGDEWVINGDKFFSSGAENADLILLMAVTDTDASPYQGMSMFIVPTNAPGVRIYGRLGGRPGDDDHGVGFGHHPYIRYQDVRVPADHLIGEPGKAFEMAQRRLSAGRMHHAMRAVALAKREFEMICERALSRYTQGQMLAEKQMVQEMIADAWLELTQFRLLVLQAAWVIEQHGYGAARRYVAACKVKAAEVQRDMAHKAVHIHGALGTTNTLPITRGTDWLGIADGPTEVHKVTLARQVLKDYEPSKDLWPTRFRPRTLIKARQRLDEIAASRLPAGAKDELHGLLQESTNGNDEAIERMREFMRMTTEEGLYAPWDPAARLFPPPRRRR
jgi:acyl-CoA dehydrogenase